MADGGVWTLLSDEQMTALEVDERWYRVYPPLIPEPEVPPFELITYREFAGSLEERFTVFSQDYDNYVIVFSAPTQAANNWAQIRYLDGVNEALGNDYTTQDLNADGGSVTGERTTTNFWRLNRLTAPGPAGMIIDVYGPWLDKPTAGRAVNVEGRLGARFLDTANTHSLGKSYDGFKLYSGAGMTGNVSVYGVRS